MCSVSLATAGVRSKLFLDASVSELLRWLLSRLLTLPWSHLSPMLGRIRRYRTEDWGWGWGEGGSIWNGKTPLSSSTLCCDWVVTVGAMPSTLPALIAVSLIAIRLWYKPVVLREHEPCQTPQPWAVPYYTLPPNSCASWQSLQIIIHWFSEILRHSAHSPDPALILN